MIKVNGQAFEMTRVSNAELRPGAPAFPQPELRNVSRVRYSTIYTGQIVENTADRLGVKVTGIRFVPGFPQGFHGMTDAEQRTEQRNHVGRKWTFLKRGGALVDVRNSAHVFRPQ